MQLTHENFKASSNYRDIILMCDHLESPANMGSIFRLCDAFSVNEIILGGTTPQLSSGRFKSTARSTEKYIRFRESENIIQTLLDLHLDGYVSIALEITSSSKQIQHIEIANKKIVLIIGNERQGISDDLLNHVKHQAHIEMFGKNSSMNVAQAAGIALYELTRDEKNYI